MIQVSKPDFSIGKLLATPAALEALQVADVDLIDLVERHICKDWGDLTDDDKRLNDEALHDGSRILSAYILPTEVKIWIITEAADENGERQRRLCFRKSTEATLCFKLVHIPVGFQTILRSRDGKVQSIRQSKWSI